MISGNSYFINDTKLKRIVLWLFLIFLNTITFAQQPRLSLSLNGTWDFEQTPTAFPPSKFTRKIPVPGLINMARPKVDQYDYLFSPVFPDGARERPSNWPREPRYNWYKRTIFIPEDRQGKKAVLTLLKSQYVTQVYVNGVDLGTSISCNTPIDVNVTPALKYGKENEIMIKLGDHDWLPSAVPGGLDDERATFMSGIWDDVQLSFTGDFRVNRILILPSLKNKKVTVKFKVWNFSKDRTGYGVAVYDSINATIILREKKSGKEVAETNIPLKIRGDIISPYETTLSFEDPHAWSPDDPFLYTAEIRLFKSDTISDKLVKQFGMRDFERRGKYFYLNGKKIMLRGANIGLHRFFCDPELEALPWDSAWVKKLLIDIPKKLNWNMIRNTIGLLPDFWYDLADEQGLMFQNEWSYWQSHGWDEEARKEYTDWVWSDGSHPGIVIWDALNEYKDDFIGNTLIPELKKLDPTRPWDNGFMEQKDLTGEDEIDEPHIYNQFAWRDDYDSFTDKNPVGIGQLDFWTETPQNIANAAAAQIVNEYGWLWLWRNGMPSYLGYKFYNYYLGNFKNAHANSELQAYELQWETELFRVHRQVAGVLAFDYLSGNYGITGDWFIGHIKDLTPGPTLKWFKHCFAPSAVFIDLADQRYRKDVKPYKPGEEIVFNLTGVNDHSFTVSGHINLYLLNSDGHKASSQTYTIQIPHYLTSLLPVKLKLPEKKGGYLLVCAYTPDGSKEPVISRRYIKVGELNSYNFYELDPGNL